MWRWILIGLAGLSLAGCATRGALHLDCPDFAQRSYALPKSQLLRDIQADVDPTAPAPESVPQMSDPLQRSLQSGADHARLQAAFGAGSPRRDVLLLSGGGQWGAFGVGFLSALREQHSPAFPHPQTITGVSTGALQALFLAVGTDDAFAAMQRYYAPARESDVVDRNAQWLAAVTGSIAGLKPLRRKLLAALCTDGDPAHGCPMIAALARPEAPDVFIGFVDSVDGAFHFAAIKELAQLPAAAAQQCIAGAAMASVAMPVFFQQVRVGGQDPRAYYDGGVRLSVFEAEVARRVHAAARAAGLVDSSDAADPSAPTLYVLRNGPTTVANADTPQGPAPDALSNALRAEAIVVNQLEVQSIADLRLAHPSGPILLITADGWDRAAGPCIKPKDVMFDPAFMHCLTRFGRTRAQRDPPWRALSPLAPGESAADLRLAP